MPWLIDADGVQDANLALRTWHTALKNALLRRKSAQELTGAFRKLGSKFRAPPGDVANVLLGFRARDPGTDDPLIFEYTQELLRLGLVTIGTILVATWNTSRYSKSSRSSLLDKSSAGLPICEERIFNLLTLTCMSSGLSLSWRDCHGVAFALVRWFESISQYEMTKQLENGALHSTDAFAFTAYEALTTLSITILSSQQFRKVIEQTWWKKRRPIMVTVMQRFDANILQTMQSQLAGRLSALAVIPPFLPTDEKGKPIFTDAQILQSVQDLQLINSRAGLYIWLNACLCAMPSVDDTPMLAYLQSRYAGDSEKLVTDLIISSFDVFTNVLVSKDLDTNVKVVRSFISNKLPLFLANFAAFMPLVTPETSVQMAFITIAMDAMPPISPGASEVSDALKRTRLDFLQACSLHSVISEATVAAVLHETPAVSKVAKYTKDGLVAKYSSNISSYEQLLRELDDMHGNAGAIAGCIVDTIINLCASKDTISLKNLCNLLLKRIPSMDILLQHTQVSTLLLPLCTQLNHWVHDSEQSEFTPAYEEFASILLFVLAVTHRYGLQWDDIGAQHDGSFIAGLLRESSVSKLGDELTEEEGTQLSKWIEGLYATDESGDSIGISDEVMRLCPPQSFYRLVPTLFEQSVLACKSGALTTKTFIGGLELLVEPFLLPSMVGGLSWLIEHSWEDHDDADILFAILDKLLKPSSSSQDTKSMHKVILGIIAKPLHESLQTFSQRKPDKREVYTFMEILKPYLASQSTLSVCFVDLLAWTTVPNGGIVRSLRNVIRDHVSWVSNVEPTRPPKYTHKLFVAACESIGPGAVLNAITSELADLSTAGNGSVALDICTALICAQHARSQISAPALARASRIDGGAASIRELLQHTVAETQSLLHVSAGISEALVRLNRRVEAQLAVADGPQLTMPLPMQDDTTQMMVDLGLTEDLPASALDPAMEQLLAAGTATGTDFQDADLTALGQSMDLMNPSADDIAQLASNANNIPTDTAQSILDEMDLSMAQPVQAQAQDAMQNPEDDIFADLDFGGFDDTFDFT